MAITAQGHQTGWTGLVARLIEIFGRLDEQKFLEGGKEAGFILSKSATVKQPTAV